MTGYMAPLAVPPPRPGVDDTDSDPALADSDPALLSYHASDIATLAVCLREGLVEGRLLVKPPQKRKRDVDGEREGAVYTMSSVQRRRELYESYKVFFMQDKIRLLRALKGKEGGVGFAEIQAARAATFARWETPKTVGRPVKDIGVVRARAADPLDDEDLEEFY